MVSIRVLNQQREVEERKQRIDIARRLSAQAGVESARRYEEQKRRQDSQVRAALHNQWEQEHQQERLLMQCVAAEGTIRQGEGMRNAAAFVDSMRRRSQVESDAWEAEHVLERERYNIALERQQLEAKMKAEKESCAALRRAQTKALEMDRSKMLLEKSRSRAHSSELQSNSVGTEKRRFGSSSVSINISTSFLNEQVKGPEAAKRHAQQREAQEQLRHAKALAEQRKAAERAKQVVKEMKLAEEQRKLEDEQEAMLKESMTANAMRSALRPVSATDFQEQEARKAQSMQRKTEAEFEKIFLRGPWSAESIERLHQGPPEPTETPIGAVTQEERAYMASGHVPLCAYTFSAVPYEEDDALDNVQEDGCPELDVSTEIAPDPQSPDELPCPTPKPSPSPPQPEPQQDPAHVTENVIAPISAPSTHDTNDLLAMRSTSSFSPLRDRQDKFLKDLEALQLRLSRATQGPAKDVNTSGSTNLTAEGDLSISSMSSQDMSTRVACSADTTASSQDHSAHRTDRRTYGLTAEQLKASVRRLQRQGK